MAFSWIGMAEQWREREGEGGFAAEEAIGSLSLDDGIACWRRRQKTHAVRTTGRKSFRLRKCRLQSRSKPTICPRSWNSRPWSWSSKLRLLGGTTGYKVDNRAAGLGLGSDWHWGAAEKAQRASFRAQFTSWYTLDSPLPPPCLSVTMGW